MIWIIASIPFWIVSGIAAILGAACTWSGLDTAMYRRGVVVGKLTLPQSTYFMIGMACWVAASCFALLAAKICS